MNVNNVGMIRSEISEMMDKIREMSAKSKAFHVDEQPAIKGGAVKSEFGEAFSKLKNVINDVNVSQNKTEEVRNAYLLGDKNITMVDVLVASQKSKLAFEGLVSVRNKILEAYKDIMNMPV